MLSMYDMETLHLITTDEVHETVTLYAGSILNVEDKYYHQQYSCSNLRNNTHRYSYNIFNQNTHV